MYANSAGNSGDLLPPSPPSEKATASQDQTGQSSTGDWAGNGSRIIRMVMVMVVMVTGDALRWRSEETVSAHPHLSDDLAVVVDAIGIGGADPQGIVDSGIDAVAVKEAANATAGVSVISDDLASVVDACRDGAAAERLNFGAGKCAYLPKTPREFTANIPCADPDSYLSHQKARTEPAGRYFQFKFLA